MTVKNTDSSKLLVDPANTPIVAGVWFVWIVAFVIGFFGKILGGYDDLDGILVLLAWGQAVQVGFQEIATLVALLSIQLAALFQLGVFFIYIWIFISFIDVALKLENLLKAFFVTFSGLIVAFISVSMVLSLFVGLFNV